MKMIISSIFLSLRLKRIGSGITKYSFNISSSLQYKEDLYCNINRKQLRHCYHLLLLFPLALKEVQTLYPIGKQIAWCSVITFLLPIQERQDRWKADRGAGLYRPPPPIQERPTLIQIESRSRRGLVSPPTPNTRKTHINTDRKQIASRACIAPHPQYKKDLQDRWKADRVAGLYRPPPPNTRKTYININGRNITRPHLRPYG